MSAGLTIFDCDGVLVDSETVCNGVMAGMLEGIGFRIGLEDCMARFVGKSMKTVQAEVEAETGLSFPEGWGDTVRAQTLAALQRQPVAAIPGIRQVVDAHRAEGRPYCVASSGRIEKMRTTLGSSGLLPLFEDVMFSAAMVGVGKPAPDLFLHAAATMGHAPGACRVVEDSLPGVQAAVAAGMPVLAYCAAPYVDAAAYAAMGARAFTNMGELLGLLGLSGSAA